MKVLVTGAAGFLGRHLVPRLLHDGHEVGVVVRNLDAVSETSFHAPPGGFADDKERSNPKAPLRLFAADLEGDKDIGAIAAEFQPNGCVHLAGRGAVRESIENPLGAVQANIVTTVHLLEALRKVGRPRVVFASTVMVNGADAPLPYREDSLGSAPASPYGAAKLTAETFCRTYARLYGLETVILRLFSVYGPGLRSFMVPHLLAVAAMSGKPFTVFGNGSSRRDYLEVADATEALVAALTRTVPFGEGNEATFNVGSGKGTALNDLIAGVERAFARKIHCVGQPAVPGELPAAWAEISRIKAVLGWEPRVSMEAGLKRLAAWFQESGE